MKKQTEKMWKWIFIIISILVIGYAFFGLLAKWGIIK